MCVPVSILRSVGKVIQGNPEEMGKKAGSLMWGIDDVVRSLEEG